MITVDSPIASVFGRSTKKRAATEKGLDLHTVGDLLHHLPRRYVELGELTRVEPHPKKPLTFVGDAVRSDIRTFQARRRTQYRVEVTVRTAGPEFVISRFTPYKSQADKYEAEVAPGSRGIFLGRAKWFNNAWGLDDPQWVVFGTEEAQQMEGSLEGLLPIYRQTAGVRSFDLQKVIQAALHQVGEMPDRLPPGLQERYDVVDALTALRLLHAPDDWAQVGTGQRRLRFEEALMPMA